MILISQQSYKAALGSNLTIFNAFSRETPGKKVYVQHLLKQNAKFINDLLSKKSNFYVCGDASHMAREVNDVLGQIIAEERGVALKKGEEVVKNMRSSGSYQEDVWS
jgi:NADPH-ferrihemoprotein reductase